MIITGKPEKITDHKWLNLFKVDWENQDKKGEWLFASRKNNPAIQRNDTDAVIIVPIHISGTYRRLVVTKEFRISLNDYEYAFPAGLKNPEESVYECASRELKEETGLNLDRIKYISPILYSSSGLTDETVTMVFCECSGTVSRAGLEGAEDISAMFLDLHDIQSLCKKYDCKHSSKLWPILYMFVLLDKIDVK